MKMIFSKYTPLKTKPSYQRPENIQNPNNNKNTTNTNLDIENSKFVGSLRFEMIGRILYNNTNCKSCGK